MPLLDFLSGAITLGFAVVSLFFFRFWKRTDDALFASFGAAFLLLALNRALLSLAATPIAESSWLYLLRLGAFTLIIVSICRKNLRTGG